MTKINNFYLKSMKNIIILFILLIINSCTPLSTISIPYNYMEYNLTRFNDMLLIDVLLNDNKAKLLIDTGASKCILDINKSEQYGFKYIPFLTNKYIGIGGLTDIYVIYDYNIDLFHVSFVGADLSDINEYFKKDGYLIVGIIGSDFLNKNGAIIDYRTNKLYMIR